MLWSVPWGCNSNGWMDRNDSLTAISATPSHFCDAILVAEEISDERKKKYKRKLVYINGKEIANSCGLNPLFIAGF